MLINHPWIKKYVQSQMHVHQEKKLHSKQSGGGLEGKIQRNFACDYYLG